MFYAALLLFLLQFQNAVAEQTIQDIGQLFQNTRIVPDIIPAFNPSVLLDVSYGRDVIPGQNLSKNGIEPLPIILKYR